MSIPKIVFQTSPKPAPDHIRDTFFRLSPNWNYLHFKDFEIIDYFTNHASEEFPKLIQKFNSFDRGEHKADLFRYYFLYLNGGIFVDSDAIPTVPLDEVSKDYSSILVAPFDSRNGIYNGILGSMPGCELIHQALIHCYNTPQELLENCYHYFCKSLGTLATAYRPENCIIYQEINKVQEGLGGSIVVDSKDKQIFTHYWKLGAVPSGQDSTPANLDTLANQNRPITNTSQKINAFILSSVSIGKRILAKAIRKTADLDYAKEFQDVYKFNKWGFGSGPGSTEENTVIYNRFIVDFIKTVDARQVTDIGCGDWQSSHFIYDNLQPIDYLGLDCTDSIIKANKIKHPRYSFRQLDVAREPSLIRDSEVYIIKDVLQHLRTKDIYKILDCLSMKNFKYIVITNCQSQNFDDEDLPNRNVVAHSRGLSANFYPLKKYGAVPLLNFKGGDNKEISIIVNRTCWNKFLPGEKWAFNPECLKIIETGLPLQRVGPKSDGGYVIIPGLDYDLFISCGIAHDIRFEEAFIASHGNINCLAFDGTIDSFPVTTKNIEWIRKNIAAFPGPSESDLTEHLTDASNVFLKMDIEGSEFDWIVSSKIETLNKFAQIVLEVHWPFDIYRSKALDKLNKTHYSVHVHGNNYNDTVIPKHLPSGRSADGTTFVKTSHGAGINFPEVFEVTFIRKDLVHGNPGKILKSFPTELDHPNCPLVEDLRFTI